MMLKASLLAFVALLALAAAAPTVFLGGSFTQLDGVYSPHFASFDTTSNSWTGATLRTVPSGGAINALAAVRNGTFAVGTFTAVGSSTSNSVAFFDGIKWCPIRQGLNGPATAVVCDSDTSCWVAGSFSQVLNVQAAAPISNFAHYTYSTTVNEWQVDTGAFGWNNASGNPLPSIDNEKLDYVGSGNNLFFVASVGSTIYRGSSADNGWFVLAGAASVHAGATAINGWSINHPDRNSLYVVTDVAGDAISVLTGSRLTSACGGSCATPTTPTDWNDVVSGAPYNASLFNSFLAVVAGPSDTRYLIGIYDPDGADTHFQARPRVLQQTGTGVPTLIGSAFVPDLSPSLLTKIGLTETNGPLVQGTFTYGNLFYPTSPVTTDAEGVLGDRRPLDSINGIAVFDSTLSRFVPFGAGGLSGNGNGAAHLTYNANNKHWYVAQTSIQWGYDLHADAVAFHDDSTDSFYPVLTRAVVSRGPSSLAPGQVFEITCETSACAAVFVGGDFAFVGPDTFGAVLRAVVQTSGTPQLSAVGGGLWDSSVGYYGNDTTFQLSNGVVYALAVSGGSLYAAGRFSRTAPASGFVCLGNIAAIDSSNLAGNWQPVAGGCDDEVYDLQEYSGQLYAAGKFLKCGNAIVNRVASYSFGATTPAWDSLNNGLDNIAYSLEVFKGRLIVGGTFGHAGGLPVTGVASWDGTKWRALLPACTKDCTPGGLSFYYNVLQAPSAVWDLQRDSTGEFLFATASYSGSRFLSRWEYTEGDFGQWLVKGQIDYSGNNEPKSDGVALFINDQLLIAGQPSAGEYFNENGYLGVWDIAAENSNIGPSAVGAAVNIVRGPAGGNSGSASTLSSLLSPLLAYVF